MSARSLELIPPSSEVAHTTPTTTITSSVALHEPPSMPQPDQQDSKVYGRLKVRADDVKSFRAQPPTLFVKKTFTGGAAKRLIFIGDIHGSLKEFNQLLCKVKFKQGQDQVVLVGDLVAKGPDSVAVVRRARQIDVWAVRGNHDDRVIRWREFLDGPGKTLSLDELKTLEKSGGLPYDDFKLKKDHYTIARELSPDDITWLAALPIIMAMPPPYAQWVVLHGGADPSKALMDQVADDVIVERDITSSGPTSSSKDGTAWFDVWADKMKGFTPEANIDQNANLDFSVIRYNKIIYGHDAGRNLQIHPVTKGLDSRCVYGGQLTAFVLPGESLVNVQCASYDSGDKDARKRRRRLGNDNANVKVLHTHEELL
ncbi:hypothetical protein GGI21_003680 [Coemansia aciculifera]|nr:hypothetical protein GGI21_003680 [Coemansia aciculifera]